MVAMCVMWGHGLGVTFDPGGDQLVPRRLCGFTAGRAMGMVRAYYGWYYGC